MDQNHLHKYIRILEYHHMKHKHTVGFRIGRNLVLLHQHHNLLHSHPYIPLPHLLLLHMVSLHIVYILQGQNLEQMLQIHLHKYIHILECHHMIHKHIVSFHTDQLLEHLLLNYSQMHFHPYNHIHQEHQSNQNYSPLHY